ncbi:MAG: hypothetical protein II777_03725 [Clostridia bacterium]|nr:hypothetical protein [Clostridia bacterium]
MKNKDYSKLEAELCEGYKDLLSGVKYELPAQPRMKKKERSGAGAKIIYAVLSAAALAAVIIGLSAVSNYMKNYQPPAGKADTSAVAEKTDTATEADTVKRTEEQTEAHTDDHNGAADTVYIEEYWSGRELPDDTEKALRMIYDESAALCTSGKKILIKRPSAAKNESGEVLRTLEKRYSYRNLSNMTAVRGLNPDDYIYNEEYFYVLNSKSIYDIYFMFIASVETFTEYYVDADPNYSYHLDRMQFTYLKFSSEFKKAGYASLDEYLKEKPYGCMFVSYVGSGIYGYSDDGVKNKKIDLFGWYADNVPDAASVAESIDVTVISPTGDEYKYGDEVYINVNVKNVSDASILFVPSDYGLRIRMSPEYGGMFVPDEYVETVPSHNVDYLDPGESFVVTLKVTLADSLWLGPYGLEVEYPGGGKYTSNVFSIVLIESEAQGPFIPSAHSVEECIDRYVGSVKDRTA